jgi:hypothetical protein
MRWRNLVSLSVATDGGAVSLRGALRFDSPDLHTLSQRTKGSADRFSEGALKRIGDYPRANISYSSAVILTGKPKLTRRT